MDSNLPQELEKILPKMPKEKIFFIPAEYLTMILVALFVFLVLGGIIFIAAKTASDSSNTSLPLASGTSLLSAPSKAKEVPAVVPPQPPAGPIIPSVKPKATATPKPSTTPTPSPTPTPTPSPNSSSNPDARVVNLSMNPSTDTHSVGQTFSIDLKMDTGSDKVAAAEIHLNFDHTKLEAQSFTKGAFMTQVLANGTYDNSAGTASISVGSGIDPVSGTGTIATITFKALTSGSASVSYTSSTQTSSFDKTGNSLNNSTGSTITIN